MNKKYLKYAWLLSLITIAVLLVSACASATTSGTASTDPFPNIRRIQEAKVLKVGTGAGYYPFEMINKQGETVGFDMDIARGMADALGVELEIVDFKDFDAILPALGSGQIDLIIAGMTITPQRALVVNWSQPYFSSGQAVLINNKHKGVITDAMQLNDAKYTIVTESGTTGDVAAQKLLTNATVRPMKGGNEATLDVCNGTSDAFVYDQPLIAIQAMQYPDCVYPLLEPFTAENFGIAVRAGQPDLLQWVNTYLDSYLGSDAYNDSFKYWFEDSAWLDTVDMGE